MDDEKGVFRLVEDWLRSLGLICFAQSFYDNGYEDLEICKEISDGDLDAIGVQNVKDRNDILAAVIRLKQKTVYFELEPEDEEPQKIVVRKLDPFLLITRVKAELEDGNIQLTQPPYFYPDGSLGNLQSLAETLSFKLETYNDDVLGALEQLRRRQLPTGLYNDVTEMMEQQRQQEVKKSVSMNFNNSVRQEDPKDYLNCEVPFRRSTSMSKHDKRITKSTTNLTEAVLLDSKSMKKEQKKRKAVAKSHSVYEKPHRGILGGFSTRKRYTSLGKSESIVPAQNITLNQEQLITLMTKVKHGEMSQEKVLDQVQQHYRQSMALDVVPTLTPNQTHAPLSKKEKKKIEKEEKDKKKKNKLDRKMSGKPGHSMFYTADRDDTSSQHSSVTRVLNEEQGDDLMTIGHSSGSDISRESLDLRNHFGHKMAKNVQDTSPVSASQDSLNSSTGSISSGTSSIGSQDIGRKSRSNSVKSISKPNKAPPAIPNRDDHQLKLEGISKSLSSFNAQRNSLKSSLSAPHSKSSTPVPPPRNSSDANKRAFVSLMTSSKSLEQISPHAVTSEKKPVLLNHKEEANGKTRSSGDGKPVISNNKTDTNDNTSAVGNVKLEALAEKPFQVKSYPFAATDLDAIKRKSDDIKRRSQNSDRNSNPETPRSAPKPVSQRLPPKPPKRSDIPQEKKPIENNADTRGIHIAPSHAEGVLHKDATNMEASSELHTNQNALGKASESRHNEVPARKEFPKPPPRAIAHKNLDQREVKDADIKETAGKTGETTEKTEEAAGKDATKNDLRPHIPPRKRRSASYAPSCADSEVSDVTTSTSNTFPVMKKPDLPVKRVETNAAVSLPVKMAPKPLKPKPALLPRDLSRRTMTDTNDNKIGVVSSTSSEQNAETIKAVDCFRESLPIEQLGKDSNDKTASNGSNIKSSSLELDAKQGIQINSVKDQTLDSVERIRCRIIAKPLKELIHRKCMIEDVDLAAAPYTGQDGSWHVPFPLVSRYAQELRRPLNEVVKSADELRTETLAKNKKPFQYCNIDSVVERTNTAVVTSSVSEWLVSVGLPMFKQDFSDIGLQALEELRELSHDDVLNVGIFEMRHVELLFHQVNQIR